MMAPSTGLLAMGMGVLAMGRTTLVTTVGAMRTVPKTWATPCWATVTGGWVLGVESVMDREEAPCPPPSPPPAAVSSLLVPPSLPSSPPSVPLFRFLSDPSSAPPAPLPLDEVESAGGMEGEEEGREERDTGWKPCWREERDEERERSKLGKFPCEVFLFLDLKKLWKKCRNQPYI